MAREACGAFLGRFHVRLGDVSQQDDDEGQGEDGHGDDHGWCGVAHLGGLHGAADEVTQKDGRDGAADGIAGAAELDELVAVVSATAESVEHRVDSGVEQAHGDAGHEGAEHVDAEGDRGIDITRKELDAHADEADNGGQEGGELVAAALEDHPRGDAEAGVGDEVSQRAELREGVAGAELRLDDDAH